MLHQIQGCQNGSGCSGHGRPTSFVERNLRKPQCAFIDGGLGVVCFVPRTTKEDTSLVPSLRLLGRNGLVNEVEFPGLFLKSGRDQ